MQASQVGSESSGNESVGYDTQDHVSTASDTVVERREFTIDSESEGGYKSSEQDEIEYSQQDVPHTQATTAGSNSPVTVTATTSQSPVSMATPPLTPTTTAQQTPSPKSGEEGHGFFRQMSDHGTPLSTLKLTKLPGRPLSPRPPISGFTPVKVVPSVSPSNIVTSPTTKSPLVAGSVDVTTAWGAAQVTSPQRSSSPAVVSAAPLPPVNVSTTPPQVTNSQSVTKHSSSSSLQFPTTQAPAPVLPQGAVVQPAVTSASPASRATDSQIPNPQHLVNPAGGVLMADPVYAPVPPVVGSYPPGPPGSSALPYPEGPTATSTGGHPTNMPKLSPIYPSDMSPLGQVLGYPTSSGYAPIPPSYQYPPVLVPKPIRPVVPEGTTPELVNMDELSKALRQDLGFREERPRAQNSSGHSTPTYQPQSPVMGRPQTPGSSHSSQSSSCTNSPYLERKISGGTPSQGIKPIDSRIPMGMRHSPSQTRHSPAPPLRSVSNPVIPVKKISFDETFVMRDKRHNSGIVISQTE